MLDPSPETLTETLYIYIYRVSQKSGEFSQISFLVQSGISVDVHSIPSIRPQIDLNSKHKANRSARLRSEWYFENYFIYLLEVHTGWAIIDDS